MNSTTNVFSFTAETPKAAVSALTEVSRLKEFSPSVIMIICELKEGFRGMNL